LTFIDTNILVDVATGSPAWAEWSSQSLKAAHLRGAATINAIVYAEFAAAYSDARACELEIQRFKLTFEPITEAAAFQAAQAFNAYRLAGGGRASVLPDFFIGAHASALGVPLLTRDTRRYRTYFPKLALITPNVT
jgi:predicted nucleic acid-binding protein